MSLAKNFFIKLDPGVNPKKLFLFLYVCYKSAKSSLLNMPMMQKYGNIVKVWPEANIRDPTIKICVPGRIITRSSDIRDPTLKKQNRETTKVVSTISAVAGG